MEVLLVDLEEVLTIIDDLAVLDDLVVGKDAEDGFRGNGFARAGFTDDG